MAIAVYVALMAMQIVGTSTYLSITRDGSFYDFAVKMYNDPIIHMIAIIGTIANFIWAIIDKIRGVK